MLLIQKINFLQKMIGIKVIPMQLEINQKK